jgi:hypothetical protein
VRPYIVVKKDDVLVTLLWVVLHFSALHRSEIADADTHGQEVGSDLTGYMGPLG